MSPATWALLSGLLLACLLVGEGNGAMLRDRRAVGAPSSDGLTHERVPRNDADHAEDNAEYEYTNDEADDYDDGGSTDEEDEETPHPPPHFLSKPQNLSLRPGDNVTFDCRVDDMGKLVQMWLNGTLTITIGSQSLVEKVTRLPDNSLFIRNVQPEDSGTYTCQIASDPVATLSHNLIVPSPAKIVDHSTKQTVTLGQRLSLYCKAEGRPQPTITWSLENQPVPDAEFKDSGSTLEVASVNREHQGLYKCTADNRKGYAQNATIRVEVVSKPDIHVEREIIRSGIEEDVDLVCHVSGHPEPKVKWRKDKVELKNGGHINIFTEARQSTLRISGIEKGDFGTYFCSAKNKHGTDEKNIVLSGTPSVPKYIASNPGDDKVTLEWEIESFAPILEHELLYRKKGASEWETLKPVVKESDGSIYKVHVDIPGISSGEYEAKFHTQNEFGSTDSELVNFRGSAKMTSGVEETSSTDGIPPAAEKSEAGNDNAAPSVHNAFTPFVALLAVFTIRALSNLL